MPVTQPVGGVRRQRLRGSGQRTTPVLEVGGLCRGACVRTDPARHRSTARGACPDRLFCPEAHGDTPTMRPFLEAPRPRGGRGKPLVLFALLASATAHAQFANRHLGIEVSPMRFTDRELTTGLMAVIDFGWY